jgi:hypothetical protein
MVTLSLSSGTGPLQGTTSLDIGTAAGNGTVTFSGLRIDAAGAGKQLTAASAPLTSATSSTFAVINNPPAPGDDFFSRPQGKTFKVMKSTLLANDTDPDGHTVTISAISPTSANGGTIVTDGPWVIYTPASGFNSTDTFTYTADDGFGGSTPATVTISVAAQDNQQTQNVMGVSPDGADMLVHFVGIAGRTYTVQYTTDLNNPTWTTLGSQAAGPNGLFDYRDVAPSGPTRFYRAISPSGLAD